VALPFALAVAADQSRSPALADIIGPLRLPTAVMIASRIDSTFPRSLLLERNLYIGTSAGSIVAASLVAGVRPRSALGRLPEPPGVPVPPEFGDGQTRLRQGFASAAGVAAAAAAPLASFALSSTAPGGALLRRAALRRLPPGRRSLDDLARRVARSGPRWDGRLRIAVVELETGRRVILGAAGAPELSVPEGSARPARSPPSSGRCAPAAACTSTAGCGARRTWTPLR
jgi:hypothetical protein